MSGSPCCPILLAQRLNAVKHIFDVAMLFFPFMLAGLAKEIASEQI
jgi:hypothetical protein